MPLQKGWSHGYTKGPPKKPTKRKRRKKMFYTNRYICSNCDNEWMSHSDVFYGVDFCPSCGKENITPYISKEAKTAFSWKDPIINEKL